MLGTTNLRTAIGFLLTVLLCLSAAASFATPAQGRQAQNEPERRTIPVSVVNKDGKFVEGLTIANFRGKPVQIVSADRRPPPYRIAILVDASPSVRENNYGIAVWRAAQEAISEFSAYHQISLYVVADGVQRHEIPGGNPKQVQTAVQELVNHYWDEKPPRRSLLLDALAVVVDDLHPAQPGDAIYFITDGFDNHSNMRERELREKLSRKGVRVFVACVPIGILMKPTRESYSPVCQSFSETSGGKALRLMFNDMRPPSIGRMVVQARDLFPSLAGVYQVEIELPREVDKPRMWKLEVVDERGKKMKGVEVFYPRLLVPLEEPEGEK